jgi:hypothetical protein
MMKTIIRHSSFEFSHSFVIRPLIFDIPYSSLILHPFFTTSFIRGSRYFTVLAMLANWP